MSIEANNKCAEEQRAEYFALMPSEKLPEVSLDLRAFASKKDDNVQAGVFARQVGTVERYTNVGYVACLDEASLSAAVAKQRDLIVRWAYESCNDFETNALLMKLDDGAEPIQIAWAKQPEPQSMLDKMMGKPAPKNMVTEVPPDTPFDPDTRCGFLGKVSREYRGGGVSSRYERIVLPD